MSPEYVRLFNDGVATRRGVAVSAIRDGHLPACQVTVRPQQIMQARKGDEIVLCESCKRILYVPAASRTRGPAGRPRCTRGVAAKAAGRDRRPVRSRAPVT
jgi:hypothetical protein